MKRAIVTGATGMIASALIRKLVKENVTDEEIPMMLSSLVLSNSVKLLELLRKHSQLTHICTFPRATA